MNRLWKKEEGFSLIELIIVIAILAIIAAIAVPNLLNNIQKANESADISNAKLIADAIATAVVQNPELEGTELNIAPYPGNPNYSPRPFEVASLVYGGNAALVLSHAIANLNGNVPTIKTKKFRNAAGDKFQVLLDKDGKITVSGTKAYAPDPTKPTVTTKQLFPQS